jgi:lysophospholipase L1-like esterase
MKIKQLNPVFSFITLIFTLEILERLIDTLIGDGDGEITTLKLSVIITFTQVFLLFMVFIWLGEVFYKLKNPKAVDSSKMFLERNGGKVLLSFVLFLVFIIDFIAAQWHFKPTEAEKVTASYRTSDSNFHHGLLPNKEVKDNWGQPYMTYTNSLGFRDKAIREIPPVASQKRIVFIGDSFTEGIGVPFEKTFAGVVAESVKDSIEVLNAGCISYSPKIYYLKTKYLLEKKQLKFDELFVFIDISDIQDECTYEDFKPKEIIAATTVQQESTVLQSELRAGFPLTINFSKIAENFNENSILFHYANKMTQPQEATFNSEYYTERPMWTIDDKIYEKWGKKGVALAQENMKKLVDLTKQNNIKLTIIVYPWREQVKANDLNSRQVKVWELFSQENQVRFVNLFPDYIQAANGDYETFYKTYFIQGDVHWNEAGNKIMADKLLQLFK